MEDMEPLFDAYASCFAAPSVYKQSRSISRSVSKAFKQTVFTGAYFIILHLSIYIYVYAYIYIFIYLYMYIFMYLKSEHVIYVG